MVSNATCASSAAGARGVDDSKVPFGWAVVLAVSPVLVACSASTGPDPTRPFDIVKDGRLQSAIELGVDTQLGQQQWVTFDVDSGYAEMRYPAGQVSGAVTFLLVIQEERLRVTDDFRAFDRLEVMLNGEWVNGELGVSTLAWIDRAQDDGTTCWLRADRTDDPFESLRYEIRLDYLDGGEPSRQRRGKLFAPAQLVFVGDKARTIRVSNLRLLPRGGGSERDDGCPSGCWCEG